jgi:hypothetical protein
LRENEIRKDGKRIEGNETGGKRNNKSRLQNE